MTCGTYQGFAQDQRRTAQIRKANHLDHIAQLQPHRLLGNETQSIGPIPQKKLIALLVKNLPRNLDPLQDTGVRVEQSQVGDTFKWSGKRINRGGFINRDRVVVQPYPGVAQLNLLGFIISSRNGTTPHPNGGVFLLSTFQVIFILSAKGGINVTQLNGDPALGSQHLQAVGSSIRDDALNFQTYRVSRLPLANWSAVGRSGSGMTPGPSRTA